MPLEQVIEKMGDDFRWLKKRGHGERTVWLAQGRPHPIVTKDIRCIGKTPREALVLLLVKMGK